MEDFQNKPNLSSLKREFLVRQPISPFISSTFTDFQLERDYLVKNIFPQLDAQSREHGTYFSPIDLRWGISKEQADSGNVIKLCLDYVNNSVPFFICLLGERYGSHRSPDEPPLPKTSKELAKDAGWMDKNYMNAAESGFPWILQESFQNSSVTELEVIQAAFLNDSPHVRFYFREMERLEDLFPELSDDWREEKLKSFKSESEYAELKVTDLKKRITNKGLQVKFFRTPQQLGDLILNDWKAIIDEYYPTITLLLKEYGKEFYDDWCAHQTLAHTRTHVYVTDPVILELFEKLDGHAVGALEDQYNDLDDSQHEIASVKTREDNSASVMVVVGKRGCGKTAFISNWIKHFQAKHPGMMLLSHYVGSSAHSLDITSFMRRATFELRENYSNDESEEVLRYDMDFHSICETFSAALLMGPCVLVMDGIDELGGSYSASAQQVKEMSWLPNPIPPRCKIIVSTVKSDLTYKSLVARDDNVVHRVPVLTDTTAKRTIVTSHVKTLNDHQMDKIARCCLSDRPLFLTILANELRVLDSYKLDKRLAQFCECTTFRDLWRCVIEHWCKDYGWQRDGFKSSQSSNMGSNMSGWVDDLLCLIATSRHGLSESELLSCLHLLGYSGQSEVTRFNFARFRLATQYSMFETPDGLIMFFHNHLQEAVEHSLLGLFGTGASDNLIGSSSVLMQSTLPRQKRFYSEILAKYFWEIPHCSRRTFELPWQLDKIGDLDALCNVLSQPEVFLLMYGDGSKYQLAMKMELMQYWNVLRNHHDPYDPAEIYKDMVLVAMHEDTYIQENNTCTSKDYEEVKFKFTNLNSSEGNVTKSALHDENLEQETESVCVTQGDNSWSGSEGSLSDYEDDQKPRREMEIAKLAINAGLFLSDCDKVEASQQLLLIAHEQLVKNYPLRTDEQLLLVRVKEKLGDWNLSQSNATEASKYYQAALVTITEIPDESAINKRQLEDCKGRLMSHLGRKEVLDENVVLAEKLLKGAVEAMKNAKSTIGLATAYFNLGTLRAKQHKYHSAENCFRDALKMREKWYGKSHAAIAEVLHELADVLAKEHYKNSDMLQAEAFYRRSLSIRETSLSSDHPLVATTLFQLGNLLRSIGTYQFKTEAASVLQRSLDIQTTSLGSNHKTTKAVRSSLKGLKKELQQGDYTDGTSKQPDRRSRRQPFSSMSWHDQDLLEFERQVKEKEKKAAVKKDVNGDLAEQGRHSKYSSERFLPKSPSPFKLDALNDTNHNTPHSNKETPYRCRSKSPGIISNHSRINPKRSDTPKGKQLNTKFNKNIEFHHFERELDYEDSRSEFDAGQRITRSAPIGQRSKHLFSNEPKDRPYSSMSQVSHVTHWSKCNISSKFSIDLSNAMSIQGPHSQIKALLDDPPCPRDVYARPKYNASWYHVPGRYPKHALDYPSKRHQSRPRHNKGNFLDKLPDASHESRCTDEFNLLSDCQE